MEENDVGSAEPMAPYLPVDAIQLDYSISAVPQNLSVYKVGDKDELYNVSARLGVVHKGAFLAYDINGEWHKSFQFQHKITTRLSSESSQSIIIIQAEWVKVGEETVLVLSTNTGYQFYNTDGVKLVVKFDYQPEEGAYGRAVVSWSTKILIGNENGELLSVEYGNGIVSDLDIRTIHQAPITYMFVSGAVLASGDAIGNLSCWNLNKFTPGMTFKTPSLILGYQDMWSIHGDVHGRRAEDCLTSCAIWKSFCVATYGSGTIRLYDLKQKKLRGKIYAHSRWIVSMDLAQTTGLLLTVAEDDLIRIWQLHDDKSTVISLRTYIKVNNMVLVGGKFLNNSGTMLAVSNYASKEVYVYGQ